MQGTVYSLTKEIKVYASKNSELQRAICNIQEEVDKLTEQRNRLKENYHFEVKQKMGTQLVLDSQKRLIERGFFITQGLTSRPSTAKRPATSSTNRLASATRRTRQFLS